MSFTNLHAHYDSSVLDGMSSISGMVNKAKEYGHKSLGISDHGTMNGIVKFYKECVENDIKPIIGSEFYMDNGKEDKRFHLCLYAMDDKGLNNLYMLTTRANMENFYYKPRINYDMLIQHNEGLICTTACLGSELANAFMNRGNVADVYMRLKNIFGDRLFVEIQPNSMQSQKDYNKFIASNFPTSQITIGLDTHYVNKEDYGTHDTLLTMQTKKKKNTEGRYRFSGNEYYFMTEEEIIERLDYLPKDVVRQALDNTNVIADLCNAKIDFKSDHLPRIENDKEKLLKLVNEGMTRRLSLGDITQEELPNIRSRAIYELKNIIEKGFASYFLIVKDFYDYAEQNNIFMGVGRGSVGGSEVAFLLGITEVEPIRYGLLYERFLNPERLTHVDVDSDICYFKRDKFLKHLQEQYGKDKVAGVSAKPTFAFKTVIQDVMRVYDFTPHLIKQYSKQIGDISSFEELEDKLPNLVDKFNSVHTQIYYDMKKLHGLMSNFSKHAGGIVISTEPIGNIAPCRRDTDDETMMVVEYDKHELEDVGLWKFDVLGLKTNSVLDLTLKNIFTNQGKVITRHDLFHIDYEDKGIYEILNSGDLRGVFQLSAPSGMQVVNKTKPQCFDDIVACTSICRPGVKESELYQENKTNPNWVKPTYWNKVKHILEQSHGAIVYQEQTMLLFSEIGGYTLGEADKLRKAKSLEPERERFINGAINKGFTKEEASDLFGRFDLGYSFNKSHAVAYSMITAVCCYLMKYYRTEFISACMTLELTQAKPDIKGFITENRKYNIIFKGADINKSTDKFEPNGNTILMPLNSIERVGDNCAEHIIYSRPFGSFQDFINKVEPRKCNKSSIKNLIKGGAFDDYSPNRSTVIAWFNETLKEKEREPEYFWCDEIEIMYEKAVYGFSLNKHELDGVVSANFNDLQDGQVTINVIINEIRQTKDRKGNEMCFVKLENKACTFDGVCFSYCYKKIKGILHEGGKYTMSGKKDGSSFIIDTLQYL